MYAKSSVTEHVFLFVRNTLFCLKYILHSERCQQTQKKDRVIDKGTEQGKWQQHIPFWRFVPLKLQPYNTMVLHRDHPKISQKG